MKGCDFCHLSDRDQEKVFLRSFLRGLEIALDDLLSFLIPSLS